MYGIVLKEKEFTWGLTRAEILELLNLLPYTEVYPLELYAKEHECSAMGFITVGVADSLNFDYEKSGLHDFIANILDDTTNEVDNCTYEFKDIKIWLSR